MDELFKKHGHTVIRLPPYHCELNSIELIWSSVKHKIAMANVTQSSVQMDHLIRTAFSQVGPSEWEKHCNNVDHVAEEMWNKDALLDEVVENLNFCINTGSSDESLHDTDDE